MQRRAFLLMLPGAVAACSAPQTLDPIEEVRAALYRHDGPPAITLYTMINNKSGNGAHTSIMINAPSQRVIFDPAGSVRHPAVPERNDVLFGITPRIEEFYERAHARVTYHVVIHRKEISPQSGELALRLAQQNGPTPSAFCTNHTSRILSALPEFRGVRVTWFPSNLMEQVAALPGVTERKLFENDDDDKQVAIDAFKNEPE